ncbi:MAG: hypothetical protein AB1512_20825 [Thermodesulfobacteriota bacterium]
MKIKIHKERCSGCHLCEMVCSLFHGGRINVERSAIRIHQDDLESSMNTPRVCRQCKKMKCLEAEGLAREPERRQFRWPKGRADHCPFEALPVFEETAYHCDLCGGDPRCVGVCTTGAIRLTPPAS